MYKIWDVPIEALRTQLKCTNVRFLPMTGTYVRTMFGPHKQALVEITTQTLLNDAVMYP